MAATRNPLADDLDRVCNANPELWKELRSTRLFLTGGTGFFGSWILETLAALNERLNLGLETTVLTRDPAAFARKAPHLASNRAFRFVTGDVRKFTLSGDRFDHVIHAAAEMSAQIAAKNPELTIETIVAGTRHCLEFAANSGARNFLMTSSGGVYGTQPVSISHMPETYSGSIDPSDRRSPYAGAKRAAEGECERVKGSMQIKIARCFAFIGPYMPIDAHYAIGNFIRDRLAGGPIRIGGDGTPVRSYMYAADLAAWLLAILLRGQHLRAYNVGSEDAITIADAAQQVAAAIPPPVKVEIAGKPNRSQAADRYVPSTQRAQKELGLRCEVSLPDAIRKTHAWYAAQGAQGAGR